MRKRSARAMVMERWAIYFAQVNRIRVRPTIEIALQIAEQPTLSPGQKAQLGAMISMLEEISRLFAGPITHRRLPQLGVCGNNRGRPRTALAELCRNEVTKRGLVAVLGHIAAGTGEFKKKTTMPLTVSDRINAIRLLLLYGYGVPKRDQEIGHVRIEVVYADNRQVNLTSDAARSPHSAVPNHRSGKTISGRVLRPEVGGNHAGDEPPDSSGIEG